MAEYKVPQDVEADDKLLGPFTFRQLIYLFVTAGLITLAVALFKLFPLLALIPLPLILFFAVLALPLKKDQPMETYLMAVISFHLKPNKRLWNPGQRESTIQITAPKIVEKVRTKNISEEEATHRLSFLADIADSEGYSIRDSSNMRDDLVAEAIATPDIFDETENVGLDQMISQDTTSRREEVVNQMRTAIKENELSDDTSAPAIRKYSDQYQYTPPTNPTLSAEPTIPESSAIVQPTAPAPKQPKPEVVELANNPDFFVETISKEAKRLDKKDSGVFISLR